MKAAFSGMYDDLKMLRETAKATHISLDDIARHPECIYCGMDRNKYWYSRMLVEYEDGRVVGTCSIHCTAIDFSVNPDRVPKAVMVGDYNTKKLINAEKALWVVGGTRQGVMSIRGKWAFGEKAAAENFVKENGGRQGSFDEAVKAAFEDMYEILR
ncbi:MAG: nitrous oxide reductase accessory protein NosL [Nitrospirae bacterium]|nr:nitrous oxide reductase accessory protein NosL [Nitrospirota bacterium]